MNFDNFAIGIDIEDVERFQGKEASFYERLFTDVEIEYCNSKIASYQHYAVRYSAKEAVFKALSAFGEVGVEFKSIEIYHQNKIPQIRFLSDLQNKYEAKVSLSHDKTKAIAYVIINKKEN